MRQKSNQKDLQLLERLMEFYDAHGYHASVRDVCELAGTPSTSVAVYYLSRLEKLGLIQRTPGISRGLKILVKSPKADIRALPMRSPKERFRFHSVTVLGCKMRRFPPWPELKPLAA